MSNDTALTYWKQVLFHEAGHAVAALSVFDIAADIFVRSCEGAAHAYSAAHRFSVNIGALMTDDADPMGAIIVLAAGARAEALCLGIADSAGFKGDLTKIRSIRQIWERKSAENYWRQFRWPAESIEAQIALIPQYQLALNEIIAEADFGYPRTSSLIRSDLEPLERMATEAHEQLLAVGEEGLTDNLVLLEASRIREIWSATRNG